MSRGEVRSEHRRGDRALARPGSRRVSTGVGAAALLEVVIALAVFFLAAGVIAGALSASASASRRLALEARAADLAVSVLSEIHAGVLPAVSDGPNACEDPDRADWTWQVIVSSAESSPPEMPEKLVEVVVTEGASKFTYRLASLVPDPDAARQLDIGSEWEPYTEAP